LDRGQVDVGFGSTEQQALALERGASVRSSRSVEVVGAPPDAFLQHSESERHGGRAAIERRWLA